ncbi:MAG: hypothetical protein DRN65_03555 [Thaumarchaeota archaeon]|nr:MAG: hypothetical protein DRN65_03555 [Nitrososphaerota archaeon]
MLDERIAKQLDKFCEEHLTTKQEVIYNLITQFLYNQSKLNNLLSKTAHRSRYEQFVALVLNSTLITIVTHHEKVLEKPVIRFSRDRLLQLLSRVGLVPHTDTLKRYVLKMENEGLVINELPGGVIITANTNQFKKYLLNTDFQYELIRNLEKVEAWQERLEQKMIKETY